MKIVSHENVTCITNSKTICKMKKEKIETLLMLWRVIDTKLDTVHFIVRICCVYMKSHKLLPDLLFRAIELLFLENKKYFTSPYKWNK